MATAEDWALVSTDDSSFFIGVASLAIMTRLGEVEEKNGDETRARKMRIVADDFASTLAETGVARLPDERDAHALISLLPPDETARWSAKEKTAFMVELACTTPFAPHKLNYKRDRFDDALRLVSERIGVSAAHLAWICKWQNSAARSHGHVDWTRTALFGGGAAALIGLTAGVAAPVVAPAVAAAGLSGGAALLSGLATLGFGSVASGGLGSAAGLWLLTGAGAVAGGSAAVGIGTLLGAFDSSTATAEIVKAQVAFKVVYVDGLSEADDGTPGTAQDALRAQRDAAEELKSQACDRNEHDAPAVKNVSAVIDTLTDALKWTNKRIEEAQHERFVP